MYEDEVVGESGSAPCSSRALYNASVRKKLQNLQPTSVIKFALKKQRYSAQLVLGITTLYTHHSGDTVSLQFACKDKFKLGTGLIVMFA